MPEKGRDVPWPSGLAGLSKLTLIPRFLNVGAFLDNASGIGYAWETDWPVDGSFSQEENARGLLGMRNNKEQKLLKIAAHLISREGYNKISFQRIADKSGLHKSSLFHYFKNKEDLLLKILEQFFGEADIKLEEIIKDPTLKPEEKLKKAFVNHLKLLIEYSDNTRVYLNELKNLSKRNRGVYMKEREKYEQDLEKIVVQLKRKGYFDGLNTKTVTFGLLGMLNTVARWYKKDGSLGHAEIARTFYKMIL